MFTERTSLFSSFCKKTVKLISPNTELFLEVFTQIWVPLLYQEVSYVGVLNMLLIRIDEYRPDPSVICSLLKVMNVLELNLLFLIRSPIYPRYPVTSQITVLCYHGNVSITCLYSCLYQYNMRPEIAACFAEEFRFVSLKLHQGHRVWLRPFHSFSLSLSLTHPLSTWCSLSVRRVITVSLVCSLSLQVSLTLSIIYWISFSFQPTVCQPLSRSVSLCFHFLICFLSVSVVQPQQELHH